MTSLKIGGGIVATAAIWFGCLVLTPTASYARYQYRKLGWRQVRALRHRARRNKMTVTDFVQIALTIVGWRNERIDVLIRNPKSWKHQITVRAAERAACTATERAATALTAAGRPDLAQSLLDAVTDRKRRLAGPWEYER